jgi:hypothetical protein
VKWLRDVISAHYYFDPLGAVLFDLMVVMLAVFVASSIYVLLGRR